MEIYAIWYVLKTKKCRVYQDKNRLGFNLFGVGEEEGISSRKVLDVCIFRNRPSEDAERCRIKRNTGEKFL